ncbi:MAG: ParB family chromosome partitioning protein [Hyphomicrobiaceae bacterium]|jgi:ParB family chromosome partitioning protein
MERQALGRGLNAILGGPADRPVSKTNDAPADVEVAAAAREPRQSGGRGEPMELAIERIVPGRGQPRRVFAEDALDELAASIRQQGIIQPLVVAKSAAGYELIAGERRLRAAARAGLDRVPVVVREATGEGEILELALVENLQREDLGPLERARAYDRLVARHGLTQEQIAVRIGKSRTAVANTMRLLALPQPVLDGIEEGLLSEGHARALLGLNGAAAKIEAMKSVVRKGLSVRETEQLVSERSTVSSDPARDRKPKGRSNPLEDSLTRSLGTKVRIRGTSSNGRIEIAFFSNEELGRLIERLTS